MRFYLRWLGEWICVQSTIVKWTGKQDRLFEAIESLPDCTTCIRAWIPSRPFNSGFCLQEPQVPSQAVERGIVQPFAVEAPARELDEGRHITRLVPSSRKRGRFRSSTESSPSKTTGSPEALRIA